MYLSLTVPKTSAALGRVARIGEFVAEEAAAVTTVLPAARPRLSPLLPSRFSMVIEGDEVMVCEVCRTGVTPEEDNGLCGGATAGVLSVRGMFGELSERGTAS